MKLTPEQVYEKLSNEYKIHDQKGLIKFDLGNVGIIVTQKDVVGNIMQEWLAQWFTQNSIEYCTNPNTQMPPDFFLNKNNLTQSLLEVKAFNYDASPGFDIASFSTYYKEIIRAPYMLHCKYLIFGYTMDDNGIVEIKRMWLKNVWEITSPMNRWPIKLQVKSGVVHKIRPAKWYASRLRYALFKNMEDFLSAMEETVYMNNDTHDDFSMWKINLINSYRRFYGIKLNIPKWCDIEDSYNLTNSEEE